MVNFKNNKTMRKIGIQRAKILSDVESNKTTSRRNFRPQLKLRSKLYISHTSISDLAVPVTYHYPLLLQPTNSKYLINNLLVEFNFTKD